MGLNAIGFEELTEEYRKDHSIYEKYSSLKVPEDNYIGIRLDGRNFHKVTAKMNKPFDTHFEKIMNSTAEEIIVETGAIVAYIQSDEITVILPSESQWFDRRIEKLCSVSASIASAAFNMYSAAIGITFDARILVLPTEEHVVAMLRERTKDSMKNAASLVAHWALIDNKGLTASQATKKLHNLSTYDKIKVAESNGVDYYKIDFGSRYGRTLVWETYEKEGFNPITQESVAANRRRLVKKDINWQVQFSLP